ncbi:MAG: ribonuclease HI [Acidimicrobiaceae bacterium]|nr:ribonuclease HI [Acidimicrobiaceae bacterium]
MSWRWQLRVHTDGACLGNPGPGGWAYATDDGRTRAGSAKLTTNQRMELQAVLEAVRDLASPLDIYSDSTYVVNCFRQNWHVGWVKRGWRNSKGDPVANQDLWKPLIDLVLKPGASYTFNWVKGHAGDPQNELVDQLARSEAEKIASR